MKIAYLLLVHTNPEQINQMIKALSNGKNHFFVHVDQKSSIASEIQTSEFVHFLSNPMSVKWGDFTLVEASIRLCRQALDYDINFDYMMLISGQDYPIKSNREIENYLEANRGAEYFKVKKLPFEDWAHHSGGMDRIRVYFPKWMIDRGLKTWYTRTYWIKISKALGLVRKPKYFKEYYGVSQWFCATRGAVEYIIRYLEERPEIVKYYNNTFIPDEILFNTIIMNSPFKDKVVPVDQRYLVWTNNEKENPQVWRQKDFDHLLQQDSLFARKFDQRIDSEIMNMLDAERIKRDKELGE